MTLSGCVVHQADNANAIFGAKCCQFLKQGLRANLSAQMQEVTDLEHALRTGGQELVREFAGIVDVAAFA